MIRLHNELNLFIQLHLNIFFQLKFIQVKYEGGLGNQLFQYATARSLMRKDDVLLFDTDHYENDYLNRSFSLINYNVKGREVKNSLVKKIFTANTKLNSVVQALGSFHFIQENGFVIHTGLQEKLKLLTAIKGYWQSASYFEDIRKELLKEIIPREIPELPDWVNIKDLVAIHVRRKDYLTDDRYGFLGEIYYNNSINFLKLQLVNPTFVFFSDDIDWCKNVYGYENVIFADDIYWQKDYLQLYLMSQCKHQIIANSSFSWWGAWLNTNNNKIIIRPNEPFQDPSLYYEKYYPPSWIAL